MKYLSYAFFAIIVLFTAASCEKDEISSTEENCAIEGRWIISGLDESTLYEFADGLQYTIYRTDTIGGFGTIEDAIPNPHEYSYRNDSLVIDLNFGNFSVTKPVYKCDCKVVELGGSALYKEDHDLESCN